MPPATHDDALLLTVNEAATRLRISRSKLYECRSGQVRSVRLGKSVRIPVAELERFVDRLQEQS